MFYKNFITAALVVACLSRTGYSQDYGYRYGEDRHRYSGNATTRDAQALVQSGSFWTKNLHFIWCAS